MRSNSLLFVGALGVLVGCGSSQPNFGSLEANRRSLTVRSDVQLLELTNGMLVALAPDTRTNLVTVDMRYQVGAAQDPAGRSGLAHLAEHLTFQVPGDSAGTPLFDKLNGLALSFNAFTTHDVTHYTATALADRLDALLELEARRLETPCSAVAGPRFVRERDVVLEEEAQRKTTWTDVLGEIDRQVWGADHPYARGVGSREVAAATQAEACAFVDRYYVPTRAILVVSGNFDPAVMQPRIGRRFGPIARVSDAPGPSLPPALRLRGTKSEHYADVERPTALIYLDAPSWGSDDQPLHDAMISAVGSALLDLDRREAWVVDTAIGYVGAGHRRATLVMVEVSDPARLADVTRAVLAAGTGILVDDDDDGDADDDNDPDDQDIVHQLASLRGRLQTSTITAADRPIGRGALLADYLTFTSHRDFALHDMRGNDAITGNRLRAYAAERFRAERVHVATVIPSGRGGTGRAAVALAGPTYDLSPAQLPVDPAAAATPLKLPPIEVPVTIERLRLDNGLRILLYAAPGSPTFEARMVFPAGRVDERRGERGVAALATDLLWHDFDRQYPARTVALVNWALRLGTAVDTSVGEEFTIFGVRGLAMFGDWHLWRLAWLLHQGVYREGDLSTARQDLREAGDRETSPSGVAFRERLWGRRHPYALPPPSAEDLAELTRGQLAAWRDARFGVDGATLIVAGGFDPAAMRRHLGELFSPLPRGRAAARAALPDPVPTPGPSWIGTRIPTADQVALYVSFAARSERQRDRAARQVLTAMLEDRLRALREGLGATYGASAGYAAGVGGSTLDVYAALDPVRAPKAAAAALAAIRSLRDDPTGAAAAADFVRARRRLVGQALAASIDPADVADELEWVVRNGGDVSALGRQAEAYARLTLADVAAVARGDLDPARMVVSVDGRAEPAAAVLAELGATDVEWFDE